MEQGNNNIGSQSLAKHLVGFELWSFQFWKLCLNPCTVCYCNNQFHSITTRDLVVAWKKWFDLKLNALYEHRIWFNLQNLSFCTLPWFWQIKYGSQLSKDMIYDTLRYDIIQLILVKIKGLNYLIHTLCNANLKKIYQVWNTPHTLKQDR